MTGFFYLFALIAALASLANGYMEELNKVSKKR